MKEIFCVDGCNEINCEKSGKLHNCISGCWQQERFALHIRVSMYVDIKMVMRESEGANEYR
ncbi:hypothetical protein KSB_25610 [Ktedonobacter robiniae]|uniref:Uncharacterized protein n=1 Tax=Ktedonobacter robiniae TaxID=2778365 RepID=A0ABQ3UMV8_9CHLR|nr:hypothetical protein KSB_25610 [Ktedonobacter robiniae]